MQRPFEIIRPDYCPYCNNPRSIELYDRYNNPIRYSIFLDMVSNGRLSELKKDFAYLKCKRCGIETDAPDMDKDNLPLMPLTDIRFRLFMAYHSLQKGENR